MLPADDAREPFSHTTDSDSQIFRFPYSYTFILFTSDELLLIGSIPSFWLILGAGVVATIFQFAIPQVVNLPWIGGAIFLVGIAADATLRIVGRIRKRGLSKLSDAELLEKSSKTKGTHVPWSEIREASLDSASLSVRWGSGISRRTVRLKFHKSRFEQLRAFLSLRLGEKLETMKDLDAYVQERDARALGMFRQESFITPIRRYVFSGVIASGLLFLSSYFLYSSLFNSERQFAIINFLAAGAGLVLCILLSLTFLSSLRELTKIDKVRFSKLLRMSYVQIGVLAGVAALGISYEFFLYTGGFPLGQFVAFFSVIMNLDLIGIAVIVLSILTVRLVRRIGPLYSKKSLILVALLVSLSLASFEFTSFGSTLSTLPSTNNGANISAPPSIIVNVTTVNIDIKYLTLSSYGWLGAAYNPSTGGASVVYGGQNITDVVTFHPQGNLSHTISSIDVPTSGFTLVSTSPITPFVEGSAHPFNVTVVVRAPNENYSGPLLFDFYVS